MVGRILDLVGMGRCMKDEYQKIDLKKVIGPTPNGTALILGNEEKTFVMFIGLYEGAAIIRELNNKKLPRPLTHELIANILVGFDIELKQVVISDIRDGTFIATLVLEQKILDGEEEWSGKRNEVHIDARPSDCIILALKYGVDIYATKKVLDEVTDIREEFLEKEKNFIDFNWKEIWKEMKKPSLEKEGETFLFEEDEEREDEDEDFI